jgi:hypothetical protein
VKTRPASAARPPLPYRTFKLFLASLFQGVATGMNGSSEFFCPTFFCWQNRNRKMQDGKFGNICFHVSAIDWRELRAVIAYFAMAWFFR